MLGLDEPERSPTGVDTDGDGIVDARDNCPDVPNPDQADGDDDHRGDACDSCPDASPTRDRDGDGVDDACDSCILGPQVDDDGDGVMDACDLCPATATARQIDSDGDLIGDECDSPTTLHGDATRVLFDDFTSVGPDWDGGGAWIEGSDGSSITPAGAQTAELRWHDGDLLGASAVSVLVELSPDGQILVSLSDPSQFCMVSCTAGTCRMRLEETEFDQRGPFPFRRGTMHLTYQPTAFQTGGWGCELFEDRSRIASTALMSATASTNGLVIRASPGAKVFGVDIVQ